MHVSLSSHVYDVLLWWRGSVRRYSDTAVLLLLLLPVSVSQLHSSGEQKMGHILQLPWVMPVLVLEPSEEEEEGQGREVVEPQG